MDERIRACLFDVLSAIVEIEEFLSEIEEFAVYRNDTKTKKAVERNLEIVGEAVNRILMINPDFYLSKAKEIVGTRNRIVHGYDAISDEVFWSIVWRDLPVLRGEVETHLGESDV
ncbi:MAG: DUF86 domain-containing protein [Flavobacteriales bacterium]